MDGYSSNLKETLAAIDKYIEEQKLNIELGEKLKRLKNNPDFIDVILHGYIDTEEKKLFNILTDPSGKSPYTEDQIRRKLDSICDLKMYIGTDAHIGTIEMAASNAPENILREEEERKNVTAEYAEGNE